MPKKIEDKKLMRGQFSTVVDLETLTAAEGGKLPKEIPVLPKGEFMTLPYGNMVLNDSVFEQMIGNFKAGIRRAVPVDFDHAWENTKAAGWIKALVNKADGLWAEVDWNKLGIEAVADKVYRMISAEWSFDYVDPQKSTHHGAVLVAATLTNRPLMQSMPTITASEAGGQNDLTKQNGIMILLNDNTNSATIKTMNIAEILAKKPADRTEEEVKFLQDNAADLTDEQKTQLEGEKPADDKDGEGEGADSEGKDGEGSADDAGDDNADDADKGGEGDDKGGEAGDDSTEEVKASELARLRKLEADHKASEVLKAAEDFSKPFLKAADNTFKVSPKGKEALVKLAMSLNETQRNLLASVLNATASTKVEGKAGEDDGEGLTATEQYNTLIDSLMKAGKTPSEANKIVRKEHKEVYTAYLAENK